MESNDTIDRFLNPRRLSTLKGEMPPLHVYIIRDALRLPKSPTILKNIYPFYTIEDIKREIWIHENSDLDILPKFQFLGILSGNQYEEDYPQQGQYYVGADTEWHELGAPINTLLQLQSPLDVLKSNTGDERFVDSSGRLQSLKVDRKERVTIDDAFLIPRGGELPVFHVYTLSALLQMRTFAQPISEYDFNGRLAPYFPTFSSDSQMTPTEADIRYAETLKSYIMNRNRAIKRIDNFIGEIEPLPLSLTGVQFIRLVWDISNMNVNFEGCEALFYNLSANERRPFLRLLPLDGTPLTKLYSPGALTISESISIDLIKQWAQEKTPFNEKDYFFAKVLLYEGMNPIFGTLRIQEDGTADFIVTPPKNIRKLDPELELRNIKTNLTEAIDRTPLENKPYSLAEASLTVTLQLQPKSARITKQSIRDKLQHGFQPFFQEIAPLPNEQPLIMLRYKCVTNFTNEDRIFSFLTQIISKKLIDGSVSLPELPALVATEFGIEQEEAQMRVEGWFKARNNFGLADAAGNDIRPISNSGIDIAIFAQHPSYSFHIYRAEGSAHLERIYTLIDLLFNIPDNELKNEPTISEDVRLSVEARVSPEGIIERGDNQILPPTSPVEQLPSSVVNPGDGTDNFDDFLFYTTGAPEEGEVTEDVTAPPPTVTLPPPAKEVILPERVPEGKVIAAPQVRPATAPAAPEEEGPIVAGSYFINKLKELDKTLFVYKKADKSVKHYSSGCQANEDRQPLALSEQQYRRMRQEYQEDEDNGELFFREYPIREKTDPQTPPPGAEIVNIMKYGSDPGRQNYYLCPNLYCIRDEIFIRKKDFKGKKDRHDNNKPENSCPFCYGRKIQDKNRPGVNETVYERKNKPKADKPHAFIGVLTKQKNPAGLSLPCCFTDPVVLRLSEEPFVHIREYETKYSTTEKSVAPVNEVAPKTQPAILPAVTYYQLLKQHIHSEYIVGPDKYPLEPGKVGLCSAVLDTYLGQVSASLVTRTAIKQDLKRNARGFLRIGVSNSIRNRNMSLLAALAPLLVVTNTAEQVANHIRKAIYPVLFQSFNFGNLVLEFYDPKDPPPSNNELEKWAKIHLNVTIETTNRFYVERLYNAYNRFIHFLEDPSQPKELRQFAHILAEPGVLTDNGITIIVIDYSGNPNDPKTEINIRCPLQGYDSEQYANNDIVFLTHDPSGIWEPLIYTDNTPAVGREGDLHDHYFLFQAAALGKQDENVRSRIHEFRKQCDSSSLGAYTSQTAPSGKSLSESLIPKRILLNRIGWTPYGLVRDSYNHVVAATFRINSRLVAVPFADDGSLDNFVLYNQDPDKKKAEIKRIHFNWDDFKAADTADIINFYESFINIQFDQYQGYEINNIVQYTDRVAVQLKNGILIPARSITGQSKYQIKTERLRKNPEWFINKEIAEPNTSKSSGFLEDMILPLKKKDADEVFQHLRLTFSNYIGSKSAGATLRKRIQDIIERNNEIREDYLELYERRKRLEILIGPLIESWLTVSDNFSPKNSLLRIDCRIVDKGQCDNYCIWKEDTSTCSIHAPSKVTLGAKHDSKLGEDHTVDGSRFFMLRLLDELLRLPEKRRQLLYKDVSYLSSPSKTVKIGDQTIIPEVNTQWYQFLIEETLQKPLEQPIFFEEFSRDDADPRNITSNSAYILPEKLVKMIGDEAVAENLRIWKSANLYNLLISLNISLTDIAGGEKNIKKLNKEIINKIRKEKGFTVGQIDLREPDEGIIGYSQKTSDIVLIILLESGDVGFVVNSKTPRRPYIAKNELGLLETAVDAIPRAPIRLGKVPKLSKPPIPTTAPA